MVCNIYALLPTILNFYSTVFPGKTDPYVILSLGNQVIRSKKNSQTTVIGPPGMPIWNQVSFFYFPIHLRYAICIFFFIILMCSCSTGFSYACFQPQKAEVIHPSKGRSRICRFDYWYRRGMYYAQHHLILVIIFLGIDHKLFNIIE